MGTTNQIRERMKEIRKETQRETTKNIKQHETQRAWKKQRDRLDEGKRKECPKRERPKTAVKEGWKKGRTQD